MHELQDHGASNEGSGLDVRAFTQWPDVGRVDKHGNQLSRWFTLKVLDEFQPVRLPAEWSRTTAPSSWCVREWSWRMKARAAAQDEKTRSGLAMYSRCQDSFTEGEAIPVESTRTTVRNCLLMSQSTSQQEGKRALLPWRPICRLGSGVTHKRAPTKYCLMLSADTHALSACFFFRCFDT